VNEAGTVTLELLLDRLTVSPPLGAARVSPTVQAALPGAMMDAGVQVKLLNWMGVIVIVAVLLTPPALAVTTAEVELETLLARAGKVVLVAPATTVADAGTLRAELPLEMLTIVPPEGAAEDICTEQVDVPPETSAAGLQLRVDNTGGGTVTGTVTIPPVVAIGIGKPTGVTAIGSVTRIGRVLLREFALGVTVTVATLPSPIVASLIPHTRHRIEPLVALHETVLDAPEATPPDDTATVSNSAGA
jgi:hypothetical protein